MEAESGGAFSDLQADERATLAADVERGANAYYAETRRMRHALHEQQQQQPSSAGASAGAGPSHALALRRLRENEAKVRAELQQATHELSELRDKQRILDERTLDVRRSLLRAEQRLAVPGAAAAPPPPVAPEREPAPRGRSVSEAY